MEVGQTIGNAEALTLEFEWFQRVLEARLNFYFEQPCEFRSVYDIDPPELNPGSSNYGSVVSHYQMSMGERLVLCLALIPHIRPELLDKLFVTDQSLNRGYTAFGGLKAPNHGGFIPTVETALFLLAGDDIELRFLAQELFKPDHYFQEHHILTLGKTDDVEPNNAAALGISKEYLSIFTSGNDYKPDFGDGFPAKLIQTEFEWEDLVLDDHVMTRVNEIKSWILHQGKLMNEWGLGRKLKNGYRALFYGPPGTGKTMTASLLGKVTGLDTYKIDLSMVVSKYIGETEKNLAKVFDQAQNKNWILFFDEADALFGKRTQTSTSHDRFANQEVSYLLQRVEDFKGVVLLSSNFEKNLDEAFSRRFQTMVYFPLPKVDERKKLWKSAFVAEVPLEKKINLDDLARKYELSGGAMMNVVRYVYLMAVNREKPKILLDDLIVGIQQEFRKEGRTLN